MYAPPAVDLVSHHDEFGLVVLDQIPCVRCELVFEVLNELLRTVQTHSGIAPQTDSQQVIETGEVIHVSVRDKYITDAQHLARRQNGDIADIEQDRPPFELQIDEDPRVTERSIDELCVEYGPHATENTICIIPTTDSV
jgi:hypothetical protein